MRLIQAGSGVIEIALAAEFTGSCEEELADVIKTSNPAANRLIILDFSGVAFFDNTAINVLVKLHALYAGTGCRFYAVGLSQHYREVLTLTGLDTGFHINSSDSEVIKAARTTDITQAVKPEPRDIQYWAPYVQNWL